MLPTIPPSFFSPPPPSFPHPHQCDRQQDSEQGDVMQHQQELSAHEGVYGPQRMLLVLLVPFDAEAIVVTEIHGEDVVCHVGHTIPDDKVGGQPVPEEETNKTHVNIIDCFPRSLFHVTMVLSCLH